MEQENLALNPNAGRNGESLQKHSRVRNFIEGFLSSAGQNANRALEQGNVGWGGVAQALGGGVGGGAVQAADQNIDVRQRHALAVAENQDALDRLTNTEYKDAQIGDIRAHSEARAAQADARERELNIRQQGQDSKDDYYKESAALRKLAIDNNWSIAQFKQEQAKIDTKYKQDRLGETVRHDKVTEGIGQQNANSNETRANRPPSGSVSNPTASQSQLEANNAEIADLLSQDQKEATYNPILDKITGKPATNEKGEILYGNTPTQQYKDRHKRITQLQKDNARLQGEVRKAPNKVSNTPAPKGYFSIKQAIAGGLSEVEAKAKAARAKAAGWVVTN
jgi:hypothetical protein